MLAATFSAFMAARTRSHRGDNPVQLAELREEHAAGEFAHAVVRAEVGLEARFASQLRVRGAEAAEVVKAGGALKEDRIVGDDGSAFPGGDGLVQLQAVDADVAV